MLLCTTPHSPMGAPWAPRLAQREVEELGNEVEDHPFLRHRDLPSGVRSLFRLVVTPTPSSW